MPYPANFNSALDVKLIRKVKKYPILYDHNELKYMDVNAREVVWHKIADDLQRPAAVCKARWINIRDMMRRRLRDRIRKPNNRVYTYKYEEELAFVKPFFKDITSCLDSQETNDLFDHNRYDGEIETLDVEDVSCEISNEVPIVVTKVAKEKKRKTSVDTEVPAMSTINESTSLDLDPSDPVDVFLMSVGSTLKTFSPYYLNKAKSEIFSIVQDYELQQIVSKNNEEQSADDTSDSVLEYECGSKVHNSD